MGRILQIASVLSGLHFHCHALSHSEHLELEEKVSSSRIQAIVRSDGKTEVQLSRTVSDGLPADIDAWGKQMELRMQQEEKEPDFMAAQDVSNSIRMVLGIPSCPGDDKVRDIIRNTWAKRPGVCLMNGITPKAPDADLFLVDRPCTATIVFFVGRGEDATPRLEGDVLTLAVPDGKICYGQRIDKKENPNEQRNFFSLTRKVYQFFKYSSENFGSWATHIARVDEDYFPAMHKIVPEIIKLDASGNSRMYLGRMMSSHHCWTRFEEIVKDPNTLENFCVYGQFYALSVKLLQDLVTPNGQQYWGLGDENVLHHPDIEDRDVGRTISRFVKQEKARILTFSPEQEKTAFPGMIG